jgi:SAM-dependent methyltransferase
MSTFYEVKNVPVHTCSLTSEQQPALEFPTGQIRLGFCKKCGFISNVDFNPAMLNYSSVYEDQQCFSSTFNVFAKNLATSLTKKYDLHNKQILEIGCGKGDFLVQLCELGNNCGIGIDPAFIKGRINSDVESRLNFISEYWSERYAPQHMDFLCCRHTLEHIHNTKEFIQSVRRAVGDNLDTVIFFEIPDVTRVLRELAFWDIYYEHCSYFTPGSLSRLFRSCKFEILDVYRDFDDQYLLLEARPVSQHSTKIHEFEDSVESIENDVNFFSANIREKLDQWKNLLRQFNADGKRVVIWGSGSKCVSFLATLGVKDEIKYIVDINPYRHGKYLPGSGKRIMAPEFLKKHKPDVTIVMNSIYRNEIQKKLDDMGVATEVITV